MNFKVKKSKIIIYINLKLFDLFRHVCYITFMKEVMKGVPKSVVMAE